MITSTKSQQRTGTPAKTRTLTHIIDAEDHSALPFIACAAMMPHIDTIINQSVVVRCSDTSWARRVCEFAQLQPDRLVSKHCIFATKQLSQQRTEGTNLTAVWTCRQSSTAGAGMYMSDLTFNLNLASGHIEIPGWFLSSEKFLPYNDLVDRLTLPSLPVLELPDSSSHDELRETVRRELGIRDGESLLVPIADPPDTIDAHWYAELTAMLEVAGHRVVLLMPRCAMHIERAVRHAREGYVRRILLSDDPVVSFLAHADIAISQGVVSGGEYLQDMLIGCAANTGCGIVLPTRYLDTSIAELMDLEYGMVGSVDHRAAGAAHAAAGLLRRIETLRRDENQLSGTRHSRWQMPRQAILQAMRKSQVSTESDFTQHCTLTMAALFDVVEAVNCSKISD